MDQFEPKLGVAAVITASCISVPVVPGMYEIQTGPDGKIYFNRYRTTLSVTTYPDTKGVGCSFEKTKSTLGMPMQS